MWISTIGACWIQSQSFRLYAYVRLHKSRQKKSETPFDAFGVYTRLCVRVCILFLFFSSSSFSGSCDRLIVWKCVQRKSVYDQCDSLKPIFRRFNWVHTDCAAHDRRYKYMAPCLIYTEKCYLKFSNINGLQF